MDIRHPTPLRHFVHPQPGDTWDTLAERTLPDQPRKQAVQALQSWNLHLVFRPPPAVITCSDVLFVEPPKKAL